MKYSDRLEHNYYDVSWELIAAIVEDLDALCIGSLMVGAVRAERFCDGALMSFFKNGSIIRWLQRLNELDEETEA